MSQFEEIPPPPPRGQALAKGRIEAFSDGVFAIAVTLLVLEIHVPKAGEVPPDRLLGALLALWPQLSSYALSFVIVGVYWVAHHLMMHGLRHVDRRLLWLNILFLMFISLIPVSADLLGQYRTAPVAVAVYGGNLVLASLSLLLWWTIATRDEHRLEVHITPAYLSVGRRRTLMAVVIYLVAIAVAWWNPLVSLCLYWLGPILYIVLPTRVDAHLESHKPGVEDDVRKLTAS